jgi:hypothetical protein
MVNGILKAAWDSTRQLNEVVPRTIKKQIARQGELQKAAEPTTTEFTIDFPFDKEMDAETLNAPAIKKAFELAQPLIQGLEELRNRSNDQFKFKIVPAWLDMGIDIRIGLFDPKGGCLLVTVSHADHTNIDTDMKLSMMENRANGELNFTPDTTPGTILKHVTQRAEDEGLITPLAPLKPEHTGLRRFLRLG